MLYLSERDVERLLTMSATLEQVESALTARALGKAVDVPRVRTRIPSGTQHILQAAAPELGVIGYKAYYSTPKGTRYFVHVFRAQTGEYLGMVAASHVGMVRTGAASGVASKHLARTDAAIVGQIGAGKQGIGQLEAVCAVRKIRLARVFSRTREKLEAFCRSMSARLGIDVVPADSAQSAVAGADVVNVITKSPTPVLEGAWLTPGQHINAAGANALVRRELDLAAVTRCDLITVDSREVARNECGDLLAAVEAGHTQWEALPEIGEIAAGLRPGRVHEQQITLYESHGMGVQDLYVCAHLLELARREGAGRNIEL
jgi:ornithine cyclodeaminase/alanine dehydrogenase-like protein (mu-crystallin family)